MIGDLAEYIQEKGAAYVWNRLRDAWPTEYQLLLLASLEMQAKELENLKGNT